MKIYELLVENRGVDDAHSSLRNANENSSDLFAISSAISVSLRANSITGLSSGLIVLIFLSHLIAYVFLKLISGKAKLYLTSKRDGRFKIASSMSSGWLVDAIVRTPSFRPFRRINKLKP